MIQIKRNDPNQKKMIQNQKKIIQNQKKMIQITLRPTNSLPYNTTAEQYSKAVSASTPKHNQISKVTQNTILKHST